MKAILAVLKYVPTVLCVLVVGIWAASSYFWITVEFPCPIGSVQMDAENGTLHLHLCVRDYGSDFYFNMKRIQRANMFGDLSYMYTPPVRSSGYSQRWFMLPFLLILTVMLPFAVGPLIRLRFPLWSWFCWTALFAAVLAFYLYR